MQYQLLRSLRKTLALSIDRSGALTVRAPLRMPSTQIEAFVREKQPWIARAQARMATLPPPRTPLLLQDGATFPFAGEVLTLYRSSVVRVTLRNHQLLYPQNTVDLAPILRWIDTQARHALEARVRYFAQVMALTPKTIRLSRAKSRWGSMSSSGTLSLNHALILCPPDVMDYVIVHELCHIPHPNHSTAFWSTVASYMPDFQAKRNWLKTNSSLITLLHG